jgi:hypothetical protein
VDHIYESKRKVHQAGRRVKMQRPGPWLRNSTLTLGGRLGFDRMLNTGSHCSATLDIQSDQTILMGAHDANAGLDKRGTSRITSQLLIMPTQSQRTQQACEIQTQGDAELNLSKNSRQQIVPLLSHPTNPRHQLDKRVQRHVYVGHFFQRLVRKICV